MKTTTRRLLWVAPVAILLNGCGGGGGGGGSGGGGGNPGGGSTAVTFTVQLTEVEIEDERRNEAVAASGLPVAGATITRN